MENYNEIKKNKLGAGILTVVIIQLVFSGLGLLSYLTFIFAKDLFVSMNLPVPGTTSLIITLVSIAINIAGLVLILFKKAIGIYIYYLIAIISLISSIIFYGFSIINLLSSLLLPGLLGFFIYKKKHLFFNNVKETNA